MDIHHKILYGAVAVIGAGLGWTDLADHRTHRTVDASLTSALASVPKRPVTVLCSPNCGDLAKNIAVRFSAAGWQDVKVESGMAANPGVWIYSLDLDASKIASAIEKADAIKAEVILGMKPYDGRFDIVVGPPEGDVQ